LDLTRDVIYRGFYLNDSSVETDLTAGSPIAGCSLDSFDFSDVDVNQFSEKRSQQDGNDAGDVFLGVRRVRVGGTLYGSTRANLFDRLWALRAALSPTLAQREEPQDKGYRPLYFSVPTDDTSYEGGLIELFIYAMPRALSASMIRDMSGGEDDDALAIPWQATFVCKDPSILGATPVDNVFTEQTIVTGATGQNTGDTITLTAHGLADGDRVRFTTLTGGGGLSSTITYYVVNKTDNTFQVSLTEDGAAVAITGDYSAVAYVVSVTNSASDLDNRGTYIAPVNALWIVGPQSGQIAATVGDSTFTIAVAASTYDRIIRFKGEDKVLTVEEVAVGDPSTTVTAEAPTYNWLTFTNGTTWPVIDPGPGQDWSFTTHGCVQQTGSHWWFYERYA